MFTPALPPPLHKYLKREHAEKMVCEGIIRIGTLLDYTNVERYGHATGDAQEGTRTKIIPTIPDGTITVDHLRMGNIIFTDCSVTGGGPGSAAFEYNEHSSQYYIYCTSIARDKKIMAAFEADTCVFVPDAHA